MHWCKQQKRGIKIIEPNDNLAKEYLQTAEETLEILRTIKNKSKVWVATTKYYFEYFAVYSILMKLGIESEIHDCTISLCSLLEEENILPSGTTKQLEDDKQLRIDNQYYLKNRDVPINYDELFAFFLKIKDVQTKLTVEKIETIRKKI
jgi:uncharacterized protein (UPF0332 family)